MKIYNRAEFMKLPENVLFAFGPHKEGVIELPATALCIKLGTFNNDFLYRSLVDLDYDNSNDLYDITEDAIKQVRTEGISGNYPLDMEATRGEGLYDNDALYTVFDKEEIKAIVSSLQSLL